VEKNWEEFKMKILIWGATSDIAFHLAKIYANEHHSFVLVARKSESLDLIKKELLSVGAKEVFCLIQDLSDLSSLKALNTQIFSQHSDISLILLAQGILVPLLENSINTEQILQENIAVNYTSHVAILNFWTAEFSKVKRGKIAVISSVAGDRGRRSNYFYGSLKGALSIFVEGLAAEMADQGVSIILIKPGLIETKMTSKLQTMSLSIKVEKAAQIIYLGINRNKSVFYVPGYWKWIMLSLKLIPFCIFKKFRF
jgi:decaprenylphospho-beta-D-erythro-pentofuranosid-2-ulose 2-reductase